MICAAPQLPSWTGILNAGKGQRPSQGRLTALLSGVLERGRTAPTEGVHGDEVCRVAAGSKFEAVQIFAIAAMLLLIPHLAAPLMLQLRGAFLAALREAFCTLVTSIAREKKRWLSGQHDRKMRTVCGKVSRLMMFEKRKIDFTGGADADRTRDLLNAIKTSRTTRLSRTESFFFSSIYSPSTSEYNSGGHRLIKSNSRDQASHLHC
jgi:hypothetical protein